MADTEQVTPTWYEVKVKIINIVGECPFGHQLNEEWTVGTKTPNGICNAAYSAIYPHIRCLQLGADYQYPAGSGVVHLSCPDIYRPVTFELTPLK
jgi:uncharacterized repeat protein (TIGR04076 family)